MTKEAKKTVVITGGSRGIGYECVKSILAEEKDWQVIIGARNIGQAGQEAAKLNRLFSGNGERVTVMKLDLASLKSTRAFSARLTDQLNTGNFPPLSGLICNAGIQTNKLSYTEDGFETTFAVNHLAHFLLVNLLLKSLAKPARIVITSSGTHDSQTLEGFFNKAEFVSTDELAYPERQGKTRLNGVRRYSTSKLCNILFGYELARRLEEKKLSLPPNYPITVNAFDPGAVPESDLLRDAPNFVRSIVRTKFTSVLMKIIGVRINTLKNAGAELARLLLDPALSRTTGKYFAGLEEKSSSRDSYDLSKAKELWESSSILVGLSAEENLL